MIINCCFHRKRNGKFENKCITGIEIKTLSWDDDHYDIRLELLKHKPVGEGWSIQGFAHVTPQEADNV